MDREALAAALEIEWTLLHTIQVHTGTSGEGIAASNRFNAIAAAARERLAQLPEKCDHKVMDCPTCHGTGKVYPAGLITLIGEAFDKGTGSRASIAVAVLDALNGETP